MSEEEEFSALLGDDVERLDLDSNVLIQTGKLDKDTVLRRQMDAQKESESLDPLQEQPVQMVDPMAILNFQRAGVQHGVMRNLRLGKYKLDAHLDLHKKTVEQARQEVYQFVQDCMAHDVRFALLTHGKGLDREQPALLKSCVAHWLPQMDAVLAFHSAQKRHGGYGSTYVLLKKSDKLKRDVRERYGRPDKG